MAKWDEWVEMIGVMCGAISMSWVFLRFSTAAKTDYLFWTYMNKYGEGYFESLIVWPMAWFALMAFVIRLQKFKVREAKDET
jgi:hypothetical protein